MLTLAVVLAAGLGTVARYVLDQVVQHNTVGEFPYGTLLVNTTGSLLLGFTVGLAFHQGLLPGPARRSGVNPGGFQRSQSPSQSRQTFRRASSGGGLPMSSGVWWCHATNPDLPR